MWITLALISSACGRDQRDSVEIGPPDDSTSSGGSEGGGAGDGDGAAERLVPGVGLGLAIASSTGSFPSSVKDRIDDEFNQVGLSWMASSGEVYLSSYAFAPEND